MDKSPSDRQLRNAATKAERTPAENRQALRRKVRIFYDLQRLRLQIGGRTQERQAEGSDIQLHEADKAMLEARAADLAKAERSALLDVQAHLKSIAFYRDVLSDKERYKGLGPTMAAVILSEFDIDRLDTPSKMWAFAGLAPVPAKRCRKCHDVATAKNGGLVHRRKKPECGQDVLSSVDVYDSGEAMRPVAGEKLRYNAFLRTKVVGVLGDCLIRSGSPWRKFYDDYKHRKASAGWGMSDGHRHRAAIRYMIKMLLLDIWQEWRMHAGLPVREPYQVEYLGHVHGGADAA